VANYRPSFQSISSRYHLRPTFPGATSSSPFFLGGGGGLGVIQEDLDYERDEFVTLAYCIQREELFYSKKMKMNRFYLVI
jgi:hypothetical protein